MGIDASIMIEWIVLLNGLGAFNNLATGKQEQQNKFGRVFEKVPIW